MWAPVVFAWSGLSKTKQKNVTEESKSLKKFSDLLDYSNSPRRRYQPHGTYVEWWSKLRMSYSTLCYFSNRFECIQYRKHRDCERSRHHSSVAHALPFVTDVVSPLSKCHTTTATHFNYLRMRHISIIWHKYTTLVADSQWGTLIRPIWQGCQEACRRWRLALDMFVPVDDETEMGLAIVHTGRSGSSACKAEFGFLGDEPRQLLRTPTKFVCARTGRNGGNSHVNIKLESSELNLRNPA